MIQLLFAGLIAIAPQMPLSVATTDDALAVFANPAGLAAGHGFDAYYLYNFAPGRFGPNNSFAVSYGPIGGFWEVESRYGLALGLGQDDGSFGLRLMRDSVVRWDAGGLVRPADWLSLGAVWNDATHGWGGLTLGAGLRPFGNRLTVHGQVRTIPFGDFGGLRSADELVAGTLVGLEAEPVDGVVLAANVDPTDRDFGFTAGVRLELGKVGIGATGTRLGDRLALDQGGALVRFGSAQRRAIVPAPKRWLELKLSGRIVERKPGFSLMGGSAQWTTWELLDLIRDAREDPGITGILLRIEGVRAGFAQIQEIRKELAEFRAAGKKVVVYSTWLSGMRYYLASVADRIVCHPLADVNIPGVSLQTLSLKGTLAKLGLEVDPVRAGEYKSAVEVFTEDSISAENREQLEAILDTGFEEFVAGASAGREMAAERFRELVDQGLFMAHEAVAAGLIDTTCYEDELDSIVAREFRGSRKLPARRYLDREEVVYDWHGAPTIAVVQAVGGIDRGRSGTDFLTGGQSIGSRSMTKLLRRLRKQGRVRAVVLRIDSPGGDGFASDEIWRELKLLKEKKPLVVSMGDVAASGGYYIACHADRLFASPTTITGSIGGFSIKLVTEGLFNKLGARRTTLKRGEHADMFSDTRPYTPEEDSILSGQVDWFYRQFLEKVADGRGLTVEAVDSVAKGRVWSGRDAQSIGLVDSLDGMLAAIEFAAERAKLDRYEVELVPGPEQGLGTMLGRAARAMLIGGE